MRTIIVYKEESDHARAVIDFLREYEFQTHARPEVIDPETPDGAQFCRTYDIVEYPSVLVTSDDGVLQHLWRGVPLPLISELESYRDGF